LRKECVREECESLDKRKIIYFEDELRDEFSKTPLEPKSIDGNYVYIRRGPLKRFTRFFWYRIVWKPIAFIYVKLFFRHKVIGKKILKKYRSQGYFLYGNHTQDLGDAFMPQFLDSRKGKHVIVDSRNLSIPFIGRLIPSLGGLPVPSDRIAAKNFLSAIEELIGRASAIIIYPEAHIWPYYTEIRPFKDDSFAYPAKLDVPAFAFTNTYKRRKRSKRPQILTYVDGPYFPDATLPLKERRKKLRDQIYSAMKERAKLSDIEIIKYLKKT